LEDIRLAFGSNDFLEESQAFGGDGGRFGAHRKGEPEAQCLLHPGAAVGQPIFVLKDKEGGILLFDWARSKIKKQIKFQIVRV
jgi:hypothetical protein